MKYRDMAAVESTNAGEMTKVVGGGVVEGKAQPPNCWGAGTVADAQPGGLARNPDIVLGEQDLDVTNLGQFNKALGGVPSLKDAFCG